MKAPTHKKKDVSIAATRPARGIAHHVAAQKWARREFQGLLEAAPDAMLMVNPTGKIVQINARAEELFVYVRSELRRVGMERHLFEGIILTGGGALLTGMCDMAEHVLNCQAANGLVTEDDIGGWPEELKSPLWTTAAGLAMYSAKLKMHRAPARSVTGLMGFVLR